MEAATTTTFPGCPFCRRLGVDSNGDVCPLCRGTCHLECEGTDNDCGAPAAALLYDTPRYPLRLCMECLGKTPAPEFETHRDGELLIVTWLGRGSAAASEAA